ncbi:quinolinate synthase NadA [candidate division TA06 bacterium]|uniref:Quinolinate synthase n=1 Tax=candidate division TA06 bacterium TaxID=2250710 RepID=A0A933IBE3_UNCT6|nr:quinolinate synthase NadA [candidate division TA06 bacterium]
MTLEEYQKLPSEKLYGLIAELKRQKDAVFLVHNYQTLDVQEIADFLGDSLALAQAAVRTKAGIIVFCGVHFMAESAKILNPGKKVLMPDVKAGCPMADMITAEALIAAKKQHDDPIVVAYVNSSAAVKAQSHICCTSSNAVKVVKSLSRDKQVLFVPDKNLGSYAAKVSGCRLILWPGYCFVHNRFTVEDVKAAREEYPGSRLIVHPECSPKVVELADEAASTSGMVKAVGEQAGVNEWIIGTEMGLVDQLSQSHPDKGIYPLARHAVCRNMKMTTLAKIAWVLEHEENEIRLSEEMAEKARESLERMLAV